MPGLQTSQELRDQYKKKLRERGPREMAVFLQAQLAIRGKNLAPKLVELIGREYRIACENDGAKALLSPQTLTSDGKPWLRDLQMWTYDCSVKYGSSEKLANGWEVCWKFSLPNSVLVWVEAYADTSDQVAVPPTSPAPSAGKSKTNVEPKPQSKKAKKRVVRPRRVAHVEGGLTGDREKAEARRLLAYWASQKRAKKLGHPGLAGSKPTWGEGPRSGLVRVEYTGQFEANRTRH